MKEIQIDPFPNLKITENAYKRDVVGNVGNKKQRNIGGKSMVSINVFNNGEKRVNAMIPETINGNTFMSVFPNPIQLYFSFSLKAFNQSEELRNKEFIKKSKKVNGEKKYFLNVDADKTHPLYNSYLQLKIGSIIMLACSIEAFVNSIITESITYKDKKGEELNQEQIQRWVSLADKIQFVIPEIYDVDFKKTYKKEYDQIMSLIRIRNEFVHLKNYNKSPFSEEYQKLFISLKKFKMKQCLKAAKKYMCEYKEDFIKEI
ncbi:hypothetical protein [Membranihabitans maritimus]|uniref:hypothetical protein n=1 Tax=Membranihabitans maritimus TaxID=2904244 RepID=UPI001F365439|nr:hypothetical protein [Membranihabitans maritimus]